MPDENPNAPMYRTLRTNLEELSNILGNPIDLNVEFHGPEHSIGIAYLESMVDENDLKAK